MTVSTMHSEHGFGDPWMSEKVSCQHNSAAIGRRSLLFWLVLSSIYPFSVAGQPQRFLTRKLPTLEMAGPKSFQQFESSPVPKILPDREWNII